MSGYRLLAMDLDGTLLEADNTVPAAVNRRLQRLSAQGVYIVLATGRMGTTARSYAAAISDQAMCISFNGALVIRGGECLFRSEVPVPLIKRMAAFCKERGLYLQMYSGDKICVEERCPELDTDPDLKYARAVELGDLTQAELRPSPKLLISHDPAAVPALIVELRQLFPELNITQSMPYLIEIMMRGVDKSDALRELARQLGVSRREVVACGDNFNDLPMVAWAGCGVAVANAVPELKNVADYVAAGERSAGVAEAIDRLFADRLS
ncbi:MAG: Cof-type HAD-IIB family hydrolase [Candidatus Methanomethylophilus sp.]|nr:Cof-type HAD-IIB family hydrolase [Methanomethylophilus sp.]